MMREAISHFVSYQLLPIVFNMSLTASVVIVFVLLARLVLKKAPKVYSYALWTVVLFRLLCPVSVTSGISLLALPILRCWKRPCRPIMWPMCRPISFTQNIRRFNCRFPV